MIKIDSLSRIGFEFALHYDSHDKDLIEFNSGHVGLMIGKNAHEELAYSSGLVKSEYRHLHR